MTLNTLPPACNLAQFGLDPRDVTAVEIICRRRINTVYRVRCGGKSHVLKWIEQPSGSVELRAYALLQREGVPVLPHRMGEQGLLLEDLDHSPAWRLADEADMERPETGLALAQWYRRFHDAGRPVLATDGSAVLGFACEVDRVTPETVRGLAGKLDLPSATILAAADRIEPIVAAIRRRPFTFNYNDFHHSNLALHRGDASQAVVFDYHLLGLGMAASDYRNVIQSLRGDALGAFDAAYGLVDDAERALDAPVATLFALLNAVESPRLPRWAGVLVGQLRSGVFMAQVEEAARYCG